MTRRARSVNRSNIACRLALLSRTWPRMAPPVGFEPTLPAPEADALSPELWGLSDVGKVTSESALRGHVPVRGAVTTPQALLSRRDARIGTGARRRRRRGDQAAYRREPAA